MTNEDTKKKVIKRDALKSVKRDVANLIEAVGSLTVAVSSMAKNNPVQTNKGKSTDDYQIGQDHPRIMKTDGPARESLEPPLVEVVDGPVTNDKLEALLFNEDELMVTVHDSTNENDDPIPAVWNGGIAQYFIRGQSQKVKRKYVEILARMKNTKYSQRKTKNANGDDQYVQIPHTALRYPFQIDYDPAGNKGRDWYRKILNEV